MKIESLTCPNCAKSLQIENLDENVKFARCPACGAQLHINYEQGSAAAQGKDSRTVIRDDATGEPIARVVVPDGWEIHGITLNIFQSIDKPYLSQVLAKSQDGSSSILIRTGEMFLDVLEQFDRISGSDRFEDGKMTKDLPMMMAHQIPYLNYLNVYVAKNYASVPLRAVADAKLPSVAGLHPELARRQLQAKYDFQSSWDMMIPNPISYPNLLSTNAASILRKYEGDGKIIMLGADMTSLEYEANLSQYAGTYGMFGLMAITRKFHGHYVAWGSENLYVCTTDAAHESEATAAFMQMISTFSFDESVYKKKFAKATEYNQAILARLQMIQAQTANLQQQLRANQARLQQQLADNSRAMSDMIMDSWDKKMMSDSRISQAQHEATMGVNTYVRTDGTTVEHSVASDHVYQNRYGDTVGVSGPAIDPSYIPDWTEIPRS